MSVRVRFIQQPDLQPLLAAERAFNSRTLEDEQGNECVVLNPWTLSATDVLDVVRTSRDSEGGTYDTRTYVAVRGVAVEGGFSLRLLPDRYEFAFLICKPGQGFGEVLLAVLKRAKDKAWRSRNRRKLVLYLRDRDEAGLRLFIPVLKEEGFKLELVPDHFGEHDGWKCTYDVED